MSRMFYPHWKCTNLCPELVDTLQHSQDTFSNTRAFNINGFVSSYVHFDLLSTWETPQKWVWLACVGVVGVVCPGFPFLKVGNYDTVHIQFRSASHCSVYPCTVW